MDLKRAEQDMKKVVVARRSGSWWTGYSTNPDEAKTVYQSTQYQKKLFILTCLNCFLTSLLSFSNIR
jgi:adenosyl cobinamide kinase/adenosyl cobinamide phosphate guanylyltransferase